MVIKIKFKTIALVFFGLIAMTAHAAAKTPDIACSIFDDSCISHPTAYDLYNRYGYSVPHLAELSPHPTANKDVPILLSSSANAVTNSMSKMMLLNNGVYLGAQASYSTRLNATDYLFMQNPRLQEVGGNMQVMNIPVNLVANNDPGGRIYAGYNFNDHFALEERYTRFAIGNIHQMTDIQYNSYTHIPKNNAYEMIARQSVPLTHGLSLLIKEGEALISTDMCAAENQTLVSNGASDHHDMIRPILGLGAGYSISQNMTADLYYSYLLETPAIHAQMVSAGLTYSVG
jgi:opacity protein-like surface antigen